MGWESYNLDKIAHDLVLKYRDKKDAPNQAYKMRVTIAYGLERFWGEQIRLAGTEPGHYWKDTWKAFAEIMAKAGIEIPQDNSSNSSKAAIDQIVNKIWELPLKQRKISLAILTQLCDSLIWWTQRYKTSGGDR